MSSQFLNIAIFFFFFCTTTNSSLSSFSPFQRYPGCTYLPNTPAIPKHIRLGQTHCFILRYLQYSLFSTTLLMMASWCNSHRFIPVSSPKWHCPLVCRILHDYISCSPPPLKSMIHGLWNVVLRMLSQLSFKNPYNLQPHPILHQTILLMSPQISKTAQFRALTWCGAKESPTGCATKLSQNSPHREHPLLSLFSRCTAPNTQTSPMCIIIMSYLPQQVVFVEFRLSKNLTSHHPPRTTDIKHRLS